MLDEGSGAMEKKLPPRQSPAQPKNNGVVSEKKSDYVSNKNGRQRKYKQSNNGGRSQELSQNPKPFQKYTQSYSDKRPRQRGYFNDRQSEEVVEAGEELFVADDTSSRKGNANYLLKFSFTPRGEGGHYESGRGSGGRFNRGGYWNRRRTTPHYSPEQFLQASCQFVVREGGEYTEQAINPDALVNWDMVEQVRTFSVETAVCPICLQKPYAGKITKCGHVYCWSCILHHLQEKELMCRKLECPICPHRIEPEELRSVVCVEMRDFKVGDEIEMKLMRKDKGSVYVCPKSEWKDREGVPHNIDDGTITQYMKLLSATCDQIQQNIIDKEKAGLDEQLKEAEEYETAFIQLAKDFLEKREESLKMKIRGQSLSDSEKDYKPTDEVCEPAVPVFQPEAHAISKADVTYIDAFEDEEEHVKDDSVTEVIDDDAFPVKDDEQDVARSRGASLDASSQDSAEDHVSSNPGSPALTLPLVNQQFGKSDHLTPEEAADHLELPEGGGGYMSQQRHSCRNKDTYYFYQASTGQPIYLNSLNAQCLTKEYGSLENSPEVISAKIVAIERIFMNEDVRKRLRYLNHIPLTCEFHVVELKFQPPLISRETLLHFQPEFDKRRRARQRKKREEKERSKQLEVEHKKTFGIYPEVQIPLDNLTQFPSHLGSSASTDSLLAVVGGPKQHSDTEMLRTSFSESGTEGLGVAASTPRQRTDSEDSQTGHMSFAQMLKVGKSIPQGSVWGRAPAHETTLHTSATAPELRSPQGRYGASPDDDDGGEYLPAPPIASSWFDDISKAMDAHIRHQAEEADNPATPPEAGRKKKKKKEKQLLFSTSMARKG